MDHPILEHRAGRFDSKVVEPGPAPVLTDKGILLIYNGGDDNLVYRTGWVLFDQTDPTRVLARAEAPVFEPKREWEESGPSAERGVCRRDDSRQRSLAALLRRGLQVRGRSIDSFGELIDCSETTRGETHSAENC